jgi:hypothetical protein
MEDGVEPAATSQLLALTLPEGANRATGADELAKFHEALQEVARTNHGTITRSEVLVWSGDAAKPVVGDLSTRLKEIGYTFAEISSFDSEAGRVTPLAVVRNDKTDSVIGMWIESKEGIKLLVWGRFKPAAGGSEDSGTEKSSHCAE